MTEKENQRRNDKELGSLIIETLKTFDFGNEIMKWVNSLQINSQKYHKMDIFQVLTPCLEGMSSRRSNLTLLLCLKR